MPHEATPEQAAMFDGLLLDISDITVGSIGGEIVLIIQTLDAEGNKTIHGQILDANEAEHMASGLYSAAIMVSLLESGQLEETQEEAN